MTAEEGAQPLGTHERDLRMSNKSYALSEESAVYWAGIMTSGSDGYMMTPKPVRDALFAQGWVEANQDVDGPIITVTDKWVEASDRLEGESGS